MMNPVADLGVGLELDLHNRQLRWGRREIALTPTAFALLAFLAARPQQLAKTEEILGAVWPNVIVEEGQVKQFVGELRRILHDDPKAPRLIETVRGRGYRFVGDLRFVGVPPAPRGGAIAQVASRPEPLAGRPAAPLIGRDAERDALQAIVREHALVTIIGPGGVGKTLLSRHVVQAFASHFADGVVSVELAPLSDASLVVAAISAAAGVPGRPGDALAGLLTTLAPLELLLVLDNAEHLVDEVARVVGAILDGAPRVHVLVTSQLPLRLSAERIFRLGPLELPPPGASPAAVRACGAVALFLARSVAAEPALSVPDHELASVVEICRRLDGVPLAVELAAARLGALGLTPLAAAIGHGLQLLSAGDRGAPERQRTLRGALQWTHGLLSTEQQTVFGRLGVFAGSFSLASAQYVAVDRPTASASNPIDAGAVADAVAALVDCSLLKRDDADSTSFGMLQSTRLFALECLGQGLEARAVRLSQIECYTSLCHDAFGRASLERTSQARIAAEYSNIRGALEWAFDEGGDTSAGTALALALLPFWQFAIEGEESGRWIELSKAHAEPGASTAPETERPADGDAERTVAVLMQRLQAEGVIGNAEVAGIERAALLALARRLRPGELRDVDAAFKGLQHAVEIASRLIAPRTVTAAPTPGPGTTELVDAALARVADHTRAGEFDHGVDAIDTALADLGDHRQRALAAVADAERTLLEAAVEHELLRRDAFAVARRVEAVAALGVDAAETRPAWTVAYRTHEARFFDEGFRGAINLSLEVGIELVRRRLASAVNDDERREAERVLAGALAELGDRENGTGALEESIGIYRSALSHTSRERSPKTWGAFQNDLGAALLLLGMRTGQAAPLEAAAMACHEALGERRRAEAPLEWAETQHVLGMTLRSLGAEADGTGTLESAVQALTEALKERTPARAPLGHVQTLTGLGVAYSLLGRRETGVARRRQAVDAYRAALTVARPDTAPLEWAALQNNLGIELATIGEIERDVALLREAVAAYRACLTERTRERVEPHWAATQHNLGGALRVLGEMAEDGAILRESVAAFGSALQVHTRERSPLRWAATKNDLGIALIALGRHDGDPAALEEAVRVLRQALEERPRARGPIAWARTLADLAQALSALGQARDSTAKVREALATWDEARAVLSADSLPQDDADTRRLVDAAKKWLSSRGERVE